MKEKHIVLTGGGTAGHCTPNLALLPYLKNNFNNIVYVGSKNGIERSLAEQAKTDAAMSAARFSYAAGIAASKSRVKNLKEEIIYLGEF